MIPLWLYLIVSALLLGIGVFGVLSRRNAVAVFMGVELMLNAVNINLVAFWRYNTLNAIDVSGQVFAAFLFVIAAAEAAVGLAIVIAVYRMKTIHCCRRYSYPAWVRRTHLCFRTSPISTYYLGSFPIGPLVAFMIISIATNRAKLTPSNTLHYGGFHPDYSDMPVPVVSNASRVLSIIVGLSGMGMAWIIGWRLFFESMKLSDFGEQVFYQSAIMDVSR